MLNSVNVHMLEFLNKNNTTCLAQDSYGYFSL